MSLFEDNRSDAVFDSERVYRYVLSRTWDTGKPTLVWIMLNPSTADETENDPTIRRCIGYAEDWGYGSVKVVNLFALRATNPDELRDHANPVGDENNEYLRHVCEDAEKVIAGWGANGGFRDRAREVALMLDVDLYALGTTKAGHPVHPLYQPGDAEPVLWSADELSE